MQGIGLENTSILEAGMREPHKLSDPEVKTRSRKPVEMPVFHQPRVLQALEMDLGMSTLIEKCNS